MYLKVLFVLTVLTIFLVTPGAVWACPFCQPTTGINQVKAGIFDKNFFTHAAAVAAPFPILAGVVTLIYYGPPNRRRGK